MPQAAEIGQWQSNEAHKIEEGKQAQEAALIMMEMEKNKCKAAIEAAQMAQRLAELESQKRKDAEMKFLQEAEEKKKAMDALARCDVRYRKYSTEEIERATDHFAPKEKIGEGGYGPVYKAYLDHTAVAIKVLRSDISQGQKQFQREVLHFLLTSNQIRCIIDNLDRFSCKISIITIETIKFHDRCQSFHTKLDVMLEYPPMHAPNKLQNS